MGRNQYRKKPKIKITPSSTTLSRCVSCGKKIVGRRSYCDDCLPERKGETTSSFISKGPERLKELRKSGVDQAHGGEAGKKRGNQAREHLSKNKRWEEQNGNELDNIDFERDILPGLHNIAIRKIQKETGLSLRYYSLIRQGRTPHRRHWSILIRLVEENN